MQRFHQIKTFDAAAASLSDTGFLKSDHNRRPMIFAGNSRRDNSDHARMPATSAHDNRRISHRIKFTGDLLFRGKEDLFFNFLSLAILVVEKISERRSFAFILCKKKLQRFFRCA